MKSMNTDLLRSVFKIRLNSGIFEDSEGPQIFRILGGGGFKMCGVDGQDSEGVETTIGGVFS